MAQSETAEPTLTASTTVLLPVTDLAANDYNPNEMTEAQFTELLAEVAHLGRLPKPVIVRPNGTGYVIVDGEHGWRAAVKHGLAEVPCEIVDADDFEARRQTYKRNQHGTHHPVRLGQMFQQMMAARQLSQRALAKAIEVSEGTVRNALVYAEAVDLMRNRYAAADHGHVTSEDDLASKIGALSIRQVRRYVELPEGLRHHWLAGGADLEALEGSDWIHSSLYEFWPKYSDFKTAFRRVRDWSHWQFKWCIGGLTPEALGPYTQYVFKSAWVVRTPELMDAVFETIIDAAGGTARFLLTPEEFGLLVANGGVGADSHSAFMQRLEGAIAMKGLTVPPMRNFRLREQVRAQEIAKSAPAYIRDSALSVREKYAVWKTDPPGGLDDAVIEQVRRRLAGAATLQASDDDDARHIVRRAFETASARKRIKDVYRKRSNRELAEQIAKWFPIYDANDSIEAVLVRALVSKLEQFTRAELICLTQMAEAWEWDAAIAEMMRSVNNIEKAMTQ